MHNARIDSTQDLEGQTVVSACFDLSDEEVAAAVHAVRATAGERYRSADLSAEDVLEFRELTAIADEFSEPGAGARTVVLSPARLSTFRHAVEHFVETRTYAEWLRDEDREPLELLRAMALGLEQLCEEAIRAALTPQDRRAGRSH
jgi:hypothetical protein